VVDDARGVGVLVIDPHRQPVLAAFHAAGIGFVAVHAAWVAHRSARVNGEGGSEAGATNYLPLSKGLFSVRSKYPADFWHNGSVRPLAPEATCGPNGTGAEWTR
jgi:hypothetical protein